MLYTNLKHIESAAELTQIISSNNDVVVICGRMGQKCIPVYRIAEELEGLYSQVKFYDMEYDNPESAVIRNLSEVVDLKEIPFTIYYKYGNVIKATSGLQTKVQIMAILNHEFAIAVNA